MSQEHYLVNAFRGTITKRNYESTILNYVNFSATTQTGRPDWIRNGKEIVFMRREDYDILVGFVRALARENGKQV